YGTRLALTTMRDFPQGLRSVILDSTYPLQASGADVPASVQRAFDKLWEGCAADKACEAAYPDLKGIFNRTIERLNAEPVTMEVAVPGGTYTVTLTGDMLPGLLFQALYITELIPLLPRMIYTAHDGTDYELWGRLALIVTTLGERVSLGMYYSIQCGEEVYLSTREELVAADATFPEQRDAFDQEGMWTVCSKWQARPADPIENQPVASDIPTLVLAGEYDPITPPAFGESAAATLARSSFFTFPGMGHGVSISHPCPLSITLEFLRNPEAKPDSGCIADMQAPAFLVMPE
ncbi:MAG TPA: alpha/beta hydrolase, partial [Herpetosiphonaceae bacterium]|nr:alpha/beta hydrolase [Herpetosiphonaceae bacterium]